MCPLQRTPAIARAIAAAVSMAMLLTGTACTRATDAQLLQAPAAPLLEPVATIQDLMRYEVDPAADSIWDSVGSITTSSGTVERVPHSDADWAALRRNAVILVEATNLLVLPGRKVSETPFPSDGPGVLSSEQIQQQVTDKGAQFGGFAVALRATAKQVVTAVDAKDAAALLKLGETMDSQCEACHLTNWYPHEVVPPLPANSPAAP
jgi:hypothetical protein